MTASPPTAVLCNGATLPKNRYRLFENRIKTLEYREDVNVRKNIKLLLPRFVQQMHHIPDFLLDLLELATYVFCTDRLLSRGKKEAVEYQSWSRDIHVFIKVRKPSFWNQSVVKSKLREALRFMTGDRDWDFHFQRGHSTHPTSLFDRKEFLIQQAKDTSVILFSGGLDSLAGALQRLESSGDRVCLVSHRSGNPGTRLTQDKLFQGLSHRFPGRVFHYPFDCSLSEVRASDETQRTRSFLYSAIAFVLAHILDHDRFFIYENGITSINLIRRQDAINARTSRTTHPKTLFLLQSFISEVAKTSVKIENPFFLKTKTDIFRLVGESRAPDLISSSVSCSKTYNSTGEATHCGGCLQCVDRRFAAYGSECDEVDEAGIYSSDFIRDRIDDGEIRTTVVDYVRQAHDFLQGGLDKFYRERLAELADLVGKIPGVDEERTAEKVFELCKRHAGQVHRATERMRVIHGDVFRKPQEGSFLAVIDKRDYLMEPVNRLVERISQRLQKAVPLAFHTNRPNNENDFNDKVNAMLSSEEANWKREFPYFSFALAVTVPDHSAAQIDLLIESKYVKRKTAMSKITDEIGSDLTKYPEVYHKLFVVYDPERRIKDDSSFAADIEAKGRCSVLVIR